MWIRSGYPWRLGEDRIRLIGLIGLLDLLGLIGLLDLLGLGVPQ
jgi:hypothetical protein